MSSATLLPGRRECLPHTCGASRPHLQRNRLRPVSARSEQGSSRSVLDAFFYGRAFAEVANQRLGELADELLVRFGKADAERQQALREFFDEVEQKAQSELTQSSATSSSRTIPPSRQLPAGGQSTSNGFSQPSKSTAAQPSVTSSSVSSIPSAAQPPSRDLQEAVDELRAEVAATRAQLNLLKASPTKAKGSTAAGRRKPTKIPDARME